MCLIIKMHNNHQCPPTPYSPFTSCSLALTILQLVLLAAVEGANNTNSYSLNTYLLAF